MRLLLILCSVLVLTAAEQRFGDESYKNTEDSSSSEEENGFNNDAADEVQANGMKRCTLRFCCPMNLSCCSGLTCCNSKTSEPMFKCFRPFSQVTM